MKRYKLHYLVSMSQRIYLGCYSIRFFVVGLFVFHTLLDLTRFFYSKILATLLPVIYCMH